MGGFTAERADMSGIKINGEQRGAALGDFNGDARVDLVVSQNDGSTRLFLNRSADQGIRVRLRGSSRNRSGIGAGIRLIYRDGTKGPRREVQTGSGYLSQNSTKQVLGAASEPAGIEVTWPDGTIQTTPASAGKIDYEIIYPDGSPE